MILTAKEKHFINRKKKIWNHFGWQYKGTGKSFFKHNHSLNCGCSICRANTFYRRKENKQIRIKNKLNLKKEIMEANKWSKITNPKIVSYILDGEPYVIHIIKSGFENKYILVYENGLDNGNKMFDKEDIEQEFNISLDI